MGKEVHMRTTIPWLLAAMPCLSLPARTPAREDAPARRGEWSFDLVDEHGRPLPTFAHRGGTYVLGTAGQRYRVRVRNDSPRRVEVVVSVDGRDVIDGGPSSLEKHGYVVDAHGEAILDGYRLSESVGRRLPVRHGGPVVRRAGGGRARRGRDRRGRLPGAAAPARRAAGVRATRAAGALGREPRPPRRRRLDPGSAPPSARSATRRCDGSPSPGRVPVRRCS